MDDYSYDSMRLYRSGAGNIDFNIYPTKNEDRLKIVVKKYSFKDTLVEKTIDYTADYNLAFTSFREAMKDQVILTGDFKQPTGMTGTWAYVYLIKDNVEQEVTNTDLRTSLMAFEQIVKGLLK